MSDKKIFLEMSDKISKENRKKIMKNNTKNTKIFQKIHEKQHKKNITIEIQPYVLLQV